MVIHIALFKIVVIRRISSRF